MITEFNDIPRNYFMRFFGIDTGPIQLNNFEIILIKADSVLRPRFTRGLDSYYTENNQPNGFQYYNMTEKILAEEADFEGYRRIPLKPPKAYTYVDIGPPEITRLSYSWYGATVPGNPNYDPDYSNKYYKNFRNQTYERLYTFFVFDLEQATCFDLSSTTTSNLDMYIGYENNLLFKVNPKPYSDIRYRITTHINIIHSNLLYVNSSINESDFFSAYYKVFNINRVPYIKYMCGIEDGIEPVCRYTLFTWGGGLPNYTLPSTVQDISSPTWTLPNLYSESTGYYLNVFGDVITSEDYKVPVGDASYLEVYILDNNNYNIINRELHYDAAYIYVNVLGSTIQESCNLRVQYIRENSNPNYTEDCSVSVMRAGTYIILLPSAADDYF